MEIPVFYTAIRHFKFSFIMNFKLFVFYIIGVFCLTWTIIEGKPTDPEMFGDVGETGCTPPYVPDTRGNCVLPITIDTTTENLCELFDIC